MLNSQWRCAFYCQLVLLSNLGISFLLMHGGGRQITTALRAAGIKTRFHNGLRVTDDKTMGITEQVLLHEINPQIVQEINSCYAAYYENKRHKSLLKRQAMDLDSRELLQSTPLGTQLGRVGKITQVNSQLLEEHLVEPCLLVMSPIGRDRKTNLSYNINADWSAAAVAIAIKSSQLLYITDEEGLLNKCGERIPQVTPAELCQLQRDGIIGTGMIPKTQSMLQAAQDGVRNVAIVNGMEPYFLLKLVTGNGIYGTVLSA